MRWPILLLPFVLAACARPGLQADATIDCRYCAEWNRPQAPVRLAPRTWYVGVRGLSAILIDTGDGLILLDGGLPQSAPLVAANIRRLGFGLGDIRYIGLSHAHFDHAGGIAALARASGAVVVARAPAAEVLRRGQLPADDPQFGVPNSDFPAVGAIRVIADGERLELGDTALTAHATPGHTPGGTTWTWVASNADARVSVAYVDSLSPVSREGFRFADAAAADLRHSAERVRALDCERFVAPHPVFFGFPDELNDERFSCASYAARSIEWLERRLREEREQSVE